ncbi:hypothetical protein HHK36_008201 [Tetracentron sinense]|uniref:Uncharacterized protein n=1 Tax=Tetracentron sinense TaxID=13715 RepID=A0A834ZFY0_TETSI|nr:hypothetical protein HHK36_008201 [Tetracentron sinense]
MDLEECEGSTKTKPPSCSLATGKTNFPLSSRWEYFAVLGIPLFGPTVVLRHVIPFWFWIVLRHVEAIETYRVSLIHFSCTFH